MFAAKYTGICNDCKDWIEVGQQVNITKPGSRFGYRHVTCPVLAGQPDPLVAAVIAREVAEDDYFAAVFNRDATDWTFRRAGVKFAVRAAEQAQNRMIDARMAAMLEADAAGLVNLFDPLPTEEARWLNLAELARFTGDGGAADAAMGNAYGAAEAEQEAEAFLAAGA
jgi:hypothetical protein